jgi:hypothetical protein
MRLGLSGLGFGLNSLAGRFEGFSLAKALGVVFLFGFLVRLVPELIAFSSPIGYDTVHYAVVMKDGVVWANWGSFFTSSWLLYGLTVPLYAVTGVDPFVLLKFVAPVEPKTYKPVGSVGGGVGVGVACCYFFNFS